MRRRPRTLPGTDALLAGNVFLFLYPLSAVAVLAFSMAWVAYNNARFGYSGYLPWPIAQWVLTTPLGTFTVELIAGLISGLPFGVAAPWARSQFSHAVDVTELPPTAWPARPRAGRRARCRSGAVPVARRGRITGSVAGGASVF